MAIHKMKNGVNGEAARKINLAKRAKAKAKKKKKSRMRSRMGAKK